jgi:hypothetical protein
VQSRFVIAFRPVVLALAAACLHLIVCGDVLSFQEPDTVTRFVMWREVEARDEVRVPICIGSQSLFDPHNTQLRIVSLPSGTDLTSGVTRVRTIYENGYYLVIGLPGKVRPEHDEELKISIDFPGSQQDSEIVRLQQARCAFAALLPEVLSHEKTSRERRMLLGPSMSFPAGGGMELAGNAHLYRGSLIDLGKKINQIDFNLSMDRLSDPQADPNYLNVGVEFKKIIPFHWRKLNQTLQRYRVAATRLRAMTNANEATVEGPQMAEAQEMVSSTLEDTLDLKKSFFRSIEMKALAPRVEMNFSGIRPGPVINFVNNSEFQLRTAEKPFISDHLFWSLQLAPVGFESGVTLRNRDNLAQQGHGIVRLNTGGTLKIKFRFPCRDDLLADRIELEVKGMNRHLFNDESAYNPINKRNDLLVKGNRYATQVDFRYVFGFRVPFPTSIFGLKLPDVTRKPAITVSYKNGYFPPVYQFNNFVRVRFALASGDDDNSSDIRVSEQDLLRP